MSEIEDKMPETGEAMPIPMIELVDVRKSFGAKKVLDGVNLRVTKGESLAVMGGSGTGKSVMLKCILGLMKPDSGSILIAGEPMTHASTRDQQRLRAHFGMLFQGGALFDSLPIWRNVTFALTNGRGGHRKEMRDKAAMLLERVGLGTEVLDLRPSSLSGGMQKRAALARAIAHEPDILFFDEPTTGLDPVLAGRINRLIVQLVKEMGATAVTITHDLHSARTIADRVAMLHQGKVIWDGPASSLDNSGNEIVDDFVKGLE